LRRYSVEQKVDRVVAQQEQTNRGVRILCQVAEHQHPPPPLVIKGERNHDGSGGRLLAGAGSGAAAAAEIGMYLQEHREFIDDAALNAGSPNNGTYGADSNDGISGAHNEPNAFKRAFEVARGLAEVGCCTLTL
jgi:hypothetical protein